MTCHQGYLLCLIIRPLLSVTYEVILLHQYSIQGTAKTLYTMRISNPGPHGLSLCGDRHKFFIFVVKTKIIVLTMRFIIILPFHNFKLKQGVSFWTQSKLQIASPLGCNRVLLKALISTSKLDAHFNYNQNAAIIFYRIAFYLTILIYDELYLSL